MASKLRHHYAAGVYLTRSNHVLQALANRAPGTYQIDGYAMTISAQTQICWHRAPLREGDLLNWAGEPIPMLAKSSPCNTATPSERSRIAWLQYLGIADFDYFTPLLNVAATRIDVWRTVDTENTTLPAADVVARPTLCTSASQHELHYPNEDPIAVVCDASVNRYVESIFSALLKPSATTLDKPITNQATPMFYIVRPFQVNENYDFEAIDGTEARCADGGNCRYKRPHAHSMVEEIVYAPDGSILIPDTAFAHLNNEAQLAALLSYSLTANDQNLVQPLFSVQRFKGNRWSFSYQKSGRNNSDATGVFVSDINTQVLRLGISQMYLAGYDIRYAPLAWAAEQGKQRNDPTDGAQKHLPWYAEYAFNYISRFYPNVDYTKLKRGEADYQQFLKSLRQSDPEAFTGK